MLTVRILPALSVATASIIFAPSLRRTSQVKDEPTTAAAVLLQVTALTPESPSPTVPVTDKVDKLTTVSLAGEVIFIVGWSLSIPIN